MFCKCNFKQSIFVFKTIFKHEITDKNKTTLDCENKSTKNVYPHVSKASREEANFSTEKPPTCILCQDLSVCLSVIGETVWVDIK